MAAIKNLDYFYSKQQYRFLEQIVRAFSGFQYQTGYNANGAPQLVMVPCTYAVTNRQVASILRNNSENTLNSCPRISIWQSGLKFRREDLQNPNHIDKLKVTERKVSDDGTAYTKKKGNSYIVERLMPIPFQMDVQVDIWTSNLDQKYQLLEQILPILGPSFDIQNGQNPLDWTALSSVYLEDITLDSRTIPIGTDTEISISSISLRLPIWLSPPAKVKQQRIIKQIITNVLEGDDVDMTGYGDVTGGKKMFTDITTPGDHHINVKGNVITLLNSKTAQTDTIQYGLPVLHNNDTSPSDNSEFNWDYYFNAKEGLFRPTISSIWLYYTEDFEGPFVSGTLQYGPNKNQLLWQIDPDTLPANTLPPLTGVIDPLKTYPNQGLPAPTAGTSYLIANDIGPSVAWGNVTAYANDIITYQNNAWVVSFSSRNVTTQQLVLNLYTGAQLRWTGTDWTMSIDTNYAPGYWRLKL